MSVQEIVLVPTRGDCVAFHGSVVAKAEGPADHPKLFGRRHVITIYESDDGWLYLKTDFETRCLHEQGVTIVEGKLHIDDLEDLLLTYEATEFLNDSQFCARHEAKENRFKKDLWQQYDALTVQIQQQMSGFMANKAASSGECADQSLSKTSRISSWIPFRSHS